MCCATGQLGVSYGVGRVWWYQAGAMGLKVDRDGGGLVMPGERHAGACLISPAPQTASTVADFEYAQPCHAG